MNFGDRNVLVQAKKAILFGCAFDVAVVVVGGGGGGGGAVVVVVVVGSSWK